LIEDGKGEGIGLKSSLDAVTVLLP